MFYGSAGNASAGHLATEYLKLSLKVPITHVPYKGTGPQLQDLLGGRLDARAAGVPALLQPIKSGKLRAIAVGGTTRVVDSASSVPKGVPHPCNYEVAATPLEYWTFDIDCREGFKKRADGLFEQYRRTSAELVQSYNELADAGAIKKTDAGIVIHAPVDAVDVQVGAKGLDHHGQGLLFIDDDAPCYVRVVGPDAQRRLLLAQLVAKNLTYANAPMTPRAMK